MQFPVVFCGMLAIAVVGVAMDKVITIVSKVATPWENIK
jgi:sulfonate transport system permease protein